MPHTHTHTIHYRALYMSYACCYLAPLKSIRNTHPHLDTFERALRPPFCQRLKPSQIQCQLSHSSTSSSPLPTLRSNIRWMLRNWRGKEAEKLAINWGSFIMPPASYYDKCFATLRIRNVSLKEGQQKRRGESAAAATSMTCRTRYHT